MVQELSGRFQVSQRTFGLNPENAEHYGLGLKNAYGFLTNPYTSSLIVRSREEIFSRPDKTKTSQQRYEESLTGIMNFLANYFSHQRDFSGLNPSAQMWPELEKYVRSPELMTASSLEVKSLLSEIFEKLRDDFSRFGVYPSLFGSFRYGDAGKYSDIDIQFLIENADHLASKRRAIGNADILIYNRLSKNHQIKDWLESKGRMEGAVSLERMHSMLLDINEQAANCWEDYRFRGDYFYPFNWVLEGTCPMENLGRIESEVAKIKDEIVQATKVDPLFELQYCLRLYLSTQKRKEHLERR